MKNQMILKELLLISILFSTVSYPVTQSPADSISIMTDCLIKNQNSFGSWGGFNEWNYTGPIVAGLVQAYEITNNSAYIEAAERGADFIILYSGQNFLGDEAYALARLGKVTGKQEYIDIVRNFYNRLDTRKYISEYSATTEEKATFYISFHAAASHMVDANDAGIWREAIMQHLSYVGDDLSYFPVMTMGVATWALALTGPMDDTLIDPLGTTGVDYWKDVTLRDLPDILVTHQVSSGQYKGSFYIRYDHTSPSSDSYDSGYTEDSIYSLMGLIAANNYRENVQPEDANSITGEENTIRLWNFDREIQDTREVLANAIDCFGMVTEHIWYGYQIYLFFTGEMLETYSSEFVYPKE